MINNIPMWEQLICEIERPGRALKWICVPGHAELEGNDEAHQLAVEGVCMSALWALPGTSFSQRLEERELFA